MPPRVSCCPVPRQTVTIASVTLMAVLVLSELLAYIKVDTASHMAVADFHEHDTVTARLHATFPFVECTGESVLCPDGGIISISSEK